MFCHVLRVCVFLRFFCFFLSIFIFPNHSKTRDNFKFQFWVKLEFVNPQEGPFGRKVAATEEGGRGWWSGWVEGERTDRRTHAPMVWEVGWGGWLIGGLGRRREVVWEEGTGGGVGELIAF